MCQLNCRFGCCHLWCTILCPCGLLTSSLRNSKHYQRTNLTRRRSEPINTPSFSFTLPPNILPKSPTPNKFTFILSSYFPDVRVHVHFVSAQLVSSYCSGNWLSRLWSVCVDLVYGWGSHHAVGMQCQVPHVGQPVRRLNYEVKCHFQQRGQSTNW